jgi:hypothetical protein
MNRRWTIRARIMTLLLAPAIPLLAMLIFATSVTLAPALNLRDTRVAVDDVSLPVSSVISGLQAERELSIVKVSLRVQNDDTTAKLVAARRATDAAAVLLGNLNVDKSFRSAANPTTLAYLTTLREELQSLADERNDVDHLASRTSVMEFYNGLIQTTFDLYGSIARLDDHTIQAQADAVIGMARASEFLSRENAIVVGVLTSGNELLTDYTALVATINMKRYLYTQASEYLTPDQLAAYGHATVGTDFATLTRLEDDLIDKQSIGSRPAIDPTEWQNAFAAVATSLGLFEGLLATQAIKATGDAATAKEVRLAIAVAVSLLMMVILLAFSIRIARALIRRVAGLRIDALSLALDRLPSVVGRLRRGETVDLKAETPPLRYGFDELGQLGDAFTRVQETAIASAVQEANLRHGFNQVFLNIARRSQTLLHRQLSLLDAMERRTEDPDQLEELFRIDHLATRMRRHAEDLVILAGSTPGRGWRSPIPFSDVLRAAASEVEEYARISVIGVPEVGLAGRAVNDVVHLLAELLENATMFSPPDTQVAMSGQIVPNGFVIEIEDRGLGMTMAAIDEANARLLSPPDFDPANSSRLGLFVVSRLAARQGITVNLRRSSYGGVTAVALIPSELVVSPAEIGPDTHSSSLVARVPVPRPADDDTAERTVVGSAPATIAVLDAGDDATMMLTLDGLPKRSRQASVARPPQSSDPRNTEFGDFGIGRTGELDGAHPANGANGGAGINGVNGNSGGINGGPVGGLGGNSGGINGNSGGFTTDNRGNGTHATGAHAAPAEPTGTHTRRTGDTGPITGLSGAAARTHEEMRSMLSAFQSGMALGRHEASRPRHAETEPDTDLPPGTTGTDGSETPDERRPE